VTGRAPEKSLFLRGIAAIRTPAALPALAIAVALLAYQVSVTVTGLRFPVPWPDEASFLWPALGFRDHFDLFAPEVNPEREALWMPPGFMVLYGLVFSVVPFMLERARIVATILVMITVLSVFGLVHRLRARAAHTALLAALLTAPIVFMVGNCARMESLVLALVTVGYFLLSRGRAAGFAVVALAPLAHPNGVFALTGAFVYAAILFWRRRRPPSPGVTVLLFGRADFACLGATAAAWIAYAVHVAKHFEAFKIDMAAQLRFKLLVSYGEDDVLVRLTAWPIALGLAALLAGGILGRRAQAPILGIFILTVSLFVQTAVAAGWLYEVYPALAITLALVMLVESVWLAIGARLSGRGAVAARVALGLVAAVTLVAAYRARFLTRSLEKATIARDSLHPPYLVRDDRRMVRGAIKQLVKERGRVTVQFIPSGEGLVYESARSPEVAFVEQTFYQNKFDVIMVHESVWSPRAVNDLELYHAVTIAPQPVRGPITFHSRDGTEKWSVYIAGNGPVPPVFRPR
jgi:hypothetical protein